LYVFRDRPTCLLKSGCWSAFLMALCLAECCVISARLQRTHTIMKAPYCTCACEAQRTTHQGHAIMKVCVVTSRSTMQSLTTSIQVHLPATGHSL
jgi:cytochrome bd-type quinol oxidase subunit 1